MSFDLSTAQPVATGGFDLSTAKPVDSNDPAVSAAPTPTSGFSEFLKNAASAAVRPVIKAVTSIPALAADTGVALRNLGTNLSQGITPTFSDFNPWAKSGGTPQTYELPSQSFNRALDTYTRAPTGIIGKGAELVSTMLAGSQLPQPEAAVRAPENFTPPPPSNLTPAQVRAAAVGNQMGMKMLPGQSSGSPALQQFEAKLESNPWTSGPVNAIKANNQSVLNTAAAQSIGENANVVDSTVLQRAADRLGETFDKVGDPSRITVVDPAKTSAAIDAVDQEAEGLINGSIRDNPLVSRLQNLADSGGINGQQLRQLSSKLGKAAYKQMSGPNGDRDMGQALYGVKDHVDDLIQSGLSGEEASTYAAARSQYRALMQLTSRVGITNPSTGNISGLSLASKLQQSDRGGYLYGGNQSDVYNAARFSQAFRPIVGNSGTATRMLSPSDLLTAHYGIPLNLASRLYTSGIGQSAVRSVMNAPQTLTDPQAMSGPIVGGLMGLSSGISDYLTR